MKLRSRTGLVATLVICGLSVMVGASNSSVALAQQRAEARSEPFAIPASDEGLPGLGPIRRAPWFQNLWSSRRTAFAQSAEQDRGAIVFLGDSITQGWEKRFAGAFPDLQLANRGISGDTSRGLPLRIGRDVFMLQPSAVVLLIGTNDLEEGASPEVIGSNMEILLQAFARSDPEMPVVLCEVFPSSETMRRPTEAIQEVNALYRAAAETYSNVTVVDTFDLFADADGNAKVQEFPDLLHPNDAGYAKWEEALRPVLAELGFNTGGR